ncbi:MAG: hypothetical protein IT530_18385 [Burkholderiales bacterium]|nr:hypothetical protein [Burkholderiales bacterium]
MLLQLEERAKTIDQLEAATGIDKKRLAYMLWNLRRLGWVTITGLLKKERWRVRAYGLARRVPPAAIPAKPSRYLPPDHIAALYAVFRIGSPPARPRGRRVRGVR